MTRRKFLKKEEQSSILVPIETTSVSSMQSSTFPILPDKRVEEPEKLKQLTRRRLNANITRTAGRLMRLAPTSTPRRTASTSPIAQMVKSACTCILM
jgi:hypothetical protein